MDGNGIRDDSTDAVTQIAYTMSKGEYLHVTTTAPGGYDHTASYDSSGRLEEEYDTVSCKTQYSYDDAFGRATTVSRAGVLVASNAYDSVNRLGSMDALDRWTRYQFDPLNRLTNTVHADGRHIQVAYAPSNDVVVMETVVSNGISILDRYLYHYDALLQRTNVVHDLDKDGVIGAGDHYTISDYNKYGEVVNVYGYDTWPVRYAYDADGNLAAITNGNNNATSFQYDARGRMTSRTFPDGSYSSYEYDNARNALSKMNMNSGGSTLLSRDYYYNAASMLTATVSQVSGVTNKVSFSYANSGLRTAMTDTNGVTQWAYAGAAEGAGVPTVKTETRLVPGVTTSVITYAYWATGMRKSMVVTNAGTRVSVLEYTYDVADRLTNLVSSIQDPGSTPLVVNYPYTYKPDWDLIESVKGVCASGTYEQSFTFDSLGRRCAVTTVNKGTTLSSRTYGYNAAGQRISQDIQSSILPPFQSSISYGYDSLGQLTNAYKTKGGVAQKDYRYAYSYDTIGNRLSEQRNSFSLTYQNNTLDQITNRSWSGGLTVQGWAASRSNMAVRGSAAGVEAVDVNVQSADLDTNGEYVVQSIAMSPGTNNLITAVNKDYPLPPNGSTNLAGTKSILWEKVAVEPQAITLRYDGAGNLTNDGVRSYTWDGNGMLTRVQCGGIRSDYGYDGLSRKVRSRDYVYTNSTWQLTQDRVFVYDGWRCVCEQITQYSTTPPLQYSKSYVWGLDLSGSLNGAGGVGGLLSSIQYQGSSIIPQFFCYDGNGNVINLVDLDSGSISAHYEYDPFGRLVCKEGVYADDNEYRFSTKRYCSKWSLYDYGYRHNSTDLGRWMSRDPMREAAGEFPENGQNTYSYVGNAPCDHVDNLGLSPLADPHAAEEWAPTQPHVPSTEPGIEDQINPFGLRGNTGKENYAQWFERRFPKTVKGAKDLLKERIEVKLCAQKDVQPTTIPDLTSKNDTVDIRPDMKRFGDEPQSFWERHVKIGYFQFKAKDVTAQWSDNCNFTYTCTVYVDEITGAQGSSEGGHDRGEDMLYYTGMFSTRHVTMAEWNESGEGDCNSDENP